MVLQINIGLDKKLFVESLLAIAVTALSHLDVST
jgi:hypothetical protein